MPFFDYISSPSKRFFIGYLVSAGLIAIIWWIIVHQKKPNREQIKRYWLHPSALLDYAYFVVSGFIKVYLIFPLVVSAYQVMLWVNEACMNYFGYVQFLPGISRETVIFLYTASLFLASDFSRYVLHRMMHAVPFLWAFHKVHHSAEVLNPVTFYRIHPVENLLFGLRYSLVIGLITGVFVYLFGAKVEQADVMGANILLFVFNLLGGNLRHSHIELSYPKWLEKVFISPRQHQLHHTQRYCRSNYGGYLAIWDYLFSTLQPTVTAQSSPYGLGQKINKNYYGIVNLFIQPLRDILCMIKSSKIKSISIKIVIGLITSAIIFLFFWLTLPSTPKDTVVNQQDKIALGQVLFFDPNLSKNRSMSCSTCHNPATAFVDSRDNGVDSMASLGDDGVSLGDRNAPTVTYAMFSPVFTKKQPKNSDDNALPTYKGGQFWDGRESTLAGQAGGPPINPIEMGMPDKSSVIERIKDNPFYEKQFAELYGRNILSDAEAGYSAMTDAIEAFEKTSDFAPFDSKYDRFLRGEYELTVLEDLGRSLFFSNNNTNCSTCHKLKREDAPNETFSNYEYHNIGVPENKMLRAKNGITKKDYGLYHNVKAQLDQNKGKFKVPTLRNVAITGPYMHNGTFKELRTVIEFYDKYNNPKRTHNPETNQPWEAPEVDENLSLKELKAKPLTERKIQALMAFLTLLTDKRYEPLLNK